MNSRKLERRSDYEVQVAEPGEHTFAAQFRKELILNTDKNTRINDDRAKDLYRARLALFSMLVLLGLAAIPYVLDRQAAVSNKPSQPTQPAQPSQSAQPSAGSAPQGPAAPASNAPAATPVASAPVPPTFPEFRAVKEGAATNRQDRTTPSIPKLNIEKKG